MRGLQAGYNRWLGVVGTQRQWSWSYRESRLQMGTCTTDEPERTCPNSAVVGPAGRWPSWFQYLMAHVNSFNLTYSCV